MIVQFPGKKKRDNDRGAAAEIAELWRHIENLKAALILCNDSRSRLTKFAVPAQMWLDEAAGAIAKQPERMPDDGQAPA